MASDTSIAKIMDIINKYGYMQIDMRLVPKIAEILDEQQVEIQGFKSKLFNNDVYDDGVYNDRYLCPITVSSYVYQSVFPYSPSNLDSIFNTLPQDKTKHYISNIDSVWLKKDYGKLVIFYNKMFQKAEDQVEPPFEYFQTDCLDLKKLENCTKAVVGDFSDICKILIMGIKDEEITTEITIFGRQFLVEDSSDCDNNQWNITFVAL